MSLLDMLGQYNPLAAGGQQQDPYALSAQLGATSPTLPTGAPNPAYNQLQQQIQQATGQQREAARASGLLNMGAAMMGATDPRTGRGAGLGQAFGAGIPAAESGIQNYQNSQRQNAMAGMQAQQMGQQNQLGQLNIQKEQNELADAAKLQQALGFSTLAPAQFAMQLRTAQGQADTFKAILNDPKSTPEQKTAAQLSLSAVSSGTPIPASALVGMFVPKPQTQLQRQVEQANIDEKHASVKHMGNEEAIAREGLNLRENPVPKPETPLAEASKVTAMRKQYQAEYEKNRSLLGGLKHTFAGGTDPEEDKYVREHIWAAMGVKSVGHVNGKPAWIDQSGNVHEGLPPGSE